MDLLGRTVGRCRIVGKLGHGGMGDIWIGEHTALQKKVVIKVLSPELTRDPSYVARFQREARLLSRLEHPNIVQIYDVGEEDGIHYLMLQFVPGMSLRRLLETNGKLSPATALRIALDVARGLQCAHENDIIHRDIKPDNILIPDDGPAKITDFGISLDETAHTELTATGRLLGTPKYISPEQARGQRAVPQSDLYSLGVTLYYMLTGREPFTGENAPSILHKHVYEKPVPPNRIVPELPQPVSDLVLRCLEKDPRKRFASARALVGELERLIRMLPLLEKRRAEEAKKPRGAPAPPAQKQPRRLALYLSIGGASALVLAVILLAVAFGRNRGSVPPESTTPAESRATEFETLLKQARDAEKAGDLDRAWQLYRQARGLGDTPELTRALQRLEPKLQELDAIEQIRSALRKQQRSTAEQLAAEFVKKYPGSRYRAEAEALLPKQPAESRSAAEYFAAGMKKYDARDYPAAAQDFKRAVQIDPSHTEAWWHLACCRYFEKEFHDALDAVTRAIEAGRRDARAYNLRGSVLVALHRYPDALQDYTRAIELDPKLAHAWHNRGIVHYEIGDYRRAIEDLTRAIELRDHADSRGQRARAYFQLKAFEAALADARRAIEMDPKQQEDLATLVSECEAGLRQAAPPRPPADPEEIVRLRALVEQMQPKIAARDYGAVLRGLEELKAETTEGRDYLGLQTRRVAGAKKVLDTWRAYMVRTFKGSEVTLERSTGATLQGRLEDITETEIRLMVAGGKITEPISGVSAASIAKLAAALKSVTAEELGTFLLLERQYLEALAYPIESAYDAVAPVAEDIRSRLQARRFKEAVDSLDKLIKRAEAFTDRRIGETISALREETAQALLDESKAARTAGKPDLAKDLLETVTNQFPDTRAAQGTEQVLRELKNDAAARLLEEARRHARARNYPRAKQMIAKILNEYRDTRAAADAGAEYARILRAEPGWKNAFDGANLSGLEVPESLQDRVTVSSAVVRIDDESDNRWTLLRWRSADSKTIEGYSAEFRVLRVKENVQYGLVAGNAGTDRGISLVCFQNTVAIRNKTEEQDTYVATLQLDRLGAKIEDWHMLTIVRDSGKWWFFFDDALVGTLAADAFQPQRDDGFGGANGRFEIRNLRLKTR